MPNKTARRFAFIWIELHVLSPKPSGKPKQACAKTIFQYTTNNSTRQLCAILFLPKHIYYPDLYWDKFLACIFFCQSEKSSYFCNWKSIGEQSSLDVHNLAMTFRASQPVDFFFLCSNGRNTILYLLARPFDSWKRILKKKIVVLHCNVYSSIIFLVFSCSGRALWWK